jgi:NAD(P)H-hydrate epimerase
LAAAVPEAVFLPQEETEKGAFAAAAAPALLEAAAGSTAVVLGPGLGRGTAQIALTQELYRFCPRPLLLDADGINAVKPHMLIEETALAPLILTPHPGEMARLLDSTIDDVQSHREEITRRFADDYGVVLTLKGYHTLIAAPTRPLLQNDTGNPGMATGGMGDILAGVIGALLARLADRHDLTDAEYDELFLRLVAVGAHIHGAAGDLAARELGEYGMTARDVLPKIPAAIVGCFG